MHMVDKVHAVVLAGGSAYGLDAAGGVMRYLEEVGAGFDTGVARVPIVPAAILYDLAIGDAQTRPDAAMGYAACQNASNAPVEQGNVGAGTGATVGKLLGMNAAVKSGLGSSSIDLGGGLMVGALVAVNAFGDVVDPKTGQVLAGLRSVMLGPARIGNEGKYAGTLETMKTLPGKVVLGMAARQNTVIGVVATNAQLDKDDTNKMAQMAQDGLARAIRPAHTMLDGDTIFALATGARGRADINLIGAYAAEALAQAIINAILYADPAGGLPSASSIKAEVV
jgi:L-aminopeptidase/D-esterase-like protein